MIKQSHLAKNTINTCLEDVKSVYNQVFTSLLIVVAIPSFSKGFSKDQIRRPIQ